MSATGRSTDRSSTTAFLAAPGTHRSSSSCKRGRVLHGRVDRLGQAPRLRDGRRSAHARLRAPAPGLGCSRVVAAALVSAILLSQAGIFAATSIRGDTLPLLLQVAAVALVARSLSTRALVAAGVLCALAITAKLAAVWAPVTIIVWLILRARRGLRPYLVSFATSLVLLLGAFELWSGGRMSETLLGRRWLRELGGSLPAPQGCRASSTSSCALRVPPGFCFPSLSSRCCWLLVSGGSASTSSPSLLVTLPLFAVVLADPGADFNHLVDLVVPRRALRRGARGTNRDAASRAVSARAPRSCLPCCWEAPTRTVKTMQSATADATKELLGRDHPPGYPTEPLAGYVDSGDPDPLRGSRSAGAASVSGQSYSTPCRCGASASTTPEWLADLESRLRPRRVRQGRARPSDRTTSGTASATSAPRSKPRSNGLQARSPASTPGRSSTGCTHLVLTSQDFFQAASRSSTGG